MKNLIITMGLILLMTMGMIHDGDSAAVLLAHRSTVRLCSEMADAAAISMEKGGSREEAETAIVGVLQKNGEENLVWEMNMSGNTIHVKVENRNVSLRIPFISQEIRVVIEEERKI